MSRASYNLFASVLTVAAWVAVAVVFAFPFYWMVNASLKAPGAISEYPPRFLPFEQVTIKLPGRRLPVVELSEGGKRVRGLLMGRGPSAGLAGVRLIREGELTRHWLMRPAAGLRQVGESLPFRGEAAPIAVGPSGERAVILGSAEIAGRGTTYYWAPEDELDGPWRIRAGPEKDFELVRRLKPRWGNYVEALTRYPFGTYFRNTLFLCVMVTLGQLISSSLAAYAFARMRFAGRDLWFMVLLATMMIPAGVTMIPMFIGYKTIGWVDSFLPLIVPQFCAGAFNVFLLRQFFMTIPTELDEAARMDGAGHLTIYWRIILPLSRPALIVVGVFTFVWCWKDLMGPLIYLDSMDKRTVALGLEYLRNPHRNNAHLIMAAAAVAMIPLAVLFLLAQKHILKGIALTGIKR